MVLKELEQYQLQKTAIALAIFFIFGDRSSDAIKY